MTEGGASGGVLGRRRDSGGVMLSGENVMGASEAGASSDEVGWDGAAGLDEVGVDGCGIDGCGNDVGRLLGGFGSRRSDEGMTADIGAGASRTTTGDA